MRERNDELRKRPSAADLAGARRKYVPDVIGPDLKVLFCGINPGLYSGATGHHFARPGNRFWPALFAGGLTPRLFRPDEKEKLLELGYGITNVVMRTTAAADELREEELREGGEALRRKVARYRPRVLAVLGMGAYRIAFGRKKVKLGLQEERIGVTRVWVLPNPSGLNAHYQAAELGAMFAELREAAERPK